MLPEESKLKSEEPKVQEKQNSIRRQPEFRDHSSLAKLQSKQDNDQKDEGEKHETKGFAKDLLKHYEDVYSRKFKIETAEWR